MSNPPVPEITKTNRALFEGCAIGELRVGHCPKCDARFRFMHEWCPECWSQDIGWQKVSGTGTVDSFSVVHQAPYEAFAEAVPYVLALIRLDEGVRIMSNVVGCDPDTVYCGMPVAVRFEERANVVLPMFTPVISER